MGKIYFNFFVLNIYVYKFFLYILSFFFLPLQYKHIIVKEVLHLPNRGRGGRGSGSL